MWSKNIHMLTMIYIFPVILLLGLSLLIKKSQADDGIDLNLFKQNDYQLKFERLEMVRFNKNIVKDSSIVTFKYNRTVTVANSTFVYKIDLGRDLVGIIQAYKFMSNEYRHFPMHFALNACKAISANVIGLNLFGKCGNFTGCPIVKGIKYHICNWFPDPSKFPPLIPNGQYKIETQLQHNSQEIAVIDMYVTISRAIV